MANHPKNRLDYLATALESEITAEMDRRRREALRDCSDDELEEALAKKRNGISRSSRDLPPKLVEK